MPTTEELMLVRIEANIKQLEREMRKASQLTDSTARKMRKSFAGAFTGGFAGGILSGVASQIDDVALAAIRAADALVDQADTINVNVEELQALQVVLRQLGGSEEDAGTGLAFFIKQLGKAQQGEGDLLKVLTSANIKLKDANGELRSREDVFRDLIHAMSLMSSEEQRFLVSTLAFGRGAAQSYVNLGEAGVAAYDDMKKAAVDSGLVQEEATTRSLARAQDAIDDFFGWLKNGWGSAIAAIIDLIKQPGLYWEIVLIDMRSVASSFWTWLKSGWRETISSVIGDFGDMSDAFDKAQGAGREIAGQVDDAMRRVSGAAEREATVVSRVEDAFTDALGATTDAVREQEEAIQLLAAARRRAADVALETPDLIAGPAEGVSEGIVAPDPAALEAAEEAAKDAAEAEREYTQAIAERQELFRDTKQDIEDSIGQLETEAQAMGLTAQEADELRAQVELLNAANRAGLEVTPELSAEIDSLAARYGQAAQAAREAADAQQAAAQLAESIGSAFEDAFVDAVTQAESLEDALKNLLKTLSELFLRLAFQRALGGLFGPSGGLAGLFGGARAGGGPVSPGRAYLVGERGPELFMPRSAGNVSPMTGAGRTAVDVRVEPSPLLVVSWERRAVAAEESAIARGPAVARANSQRYGVP